MSDPAKVGGIFDGLISGILESTAAAKKMPSLLADLDATIAAAAAMSIKGQALGATLRAASAQFEGMADDAKAMTDAASRLSADAKVLLAGYGVKIEPPK